MKESMQAFIELVSKDEELKATIESIAGNDEKKETLTEESKQQIIALAKEHGIELSSEDFVFNKDELSDEELAVISGGSGGCGCAGSGYGQGKRESDSSIDFYCACVLMGVGMDGAVPAGSYCFCTFAGGGADDEFYIQ